MWEWTSVSKVRGNSLARAGNLKDAGTQVRGKGARTADLKGEGRHYGYWYQYGKRSRNTDQADVGPR